MHTNQRIKYRARWETLAASKKKISVKNASLCPKTNPNNANAQKLKKTQRELLSEQPLEQIEYIQGQINKIRNSVDIDNLEKVWFGFFA